MKHILLFCFLLITYYSFSQQKFSKEISFVTDNDLYVSVNRDRYYTNGMFLNYRHLHKTTNNQLDKKIFEWLIGHEMYTPYKAIVTNINDHDRPFAGYLYASFGVKNVYKSNKILNFSSQMGIIGSGAFGKELQDFIHGIYGFKKAVGWKYQIKNAIALNLSSEYVNLISVNETNSFDISWVSSAKLGTIYTNVSSGFYMRFGFIPLQKIMNSIAFNTNLNNENTNYKREAESFFYIKPMLRYALYDATLQGSFLNKGSEVTKELIPLVFDIQFGLKFTVNRFNFGYIFNYNTSKSKDLRYTYGNKYGTINLNYLLR